MRGHIQKRRGRYCLVLELDVEHDPETGTRISRRVGAGSFRTRRQAEEARHDALERARQGWRGPSRLTVAEYLRGEWLPGVDLELAKTTAALYRTLMESYVIPHIGRVRLDALSSADLTRLYADLLKGGGRPRPDGSPRPLAPKTVRHVHTTLRKALADAIPARHLTWNPAQGAKPPKVTRASEPAHWTAEEIARFLNHVVEDRLAALFVVAATSGMRRGELLGLRWADLDLDAAHAQVRQTRVIYGTLQVVKEPKTTASRRTIPLAPQAVAALRRHFARQAEEKLVAGAAYADQGLVFTDEIGTPLPPARVTATFSRLVRDARLPRITLHGLRHSFATVGLHAGVDVLYVAKVLGHSSPAITMGIYQHTREEHAAEAVERIGAAIFP